MSPTELKGTSIGLHKLDRLQWTVVCSTLSGALLGKRAVIEVVSPADGVLIESLRPPVLGIVYDAASDALKIMLDGVDHFVFNPKELYMDFALGGIQSLGILDVENAWQIVLLRDPLMLPRQID
jgi:hypothetical protein